MRWEDVKYCFSLFTSKTVLEGKSEGGQWGSKCSHIFFFFLFTKTSPPPPSFIYEGQGQPIYSLYFSPPPLIQQVSATPCWNCATWLQITRTSIHLSLALHLLSGQQMVIISLTKVSSRSKWLDFKRRKYCRSGSKTFSLNGRTDFVPHSLWWQMMAGSLHFCKWKWTPF